MNKSDLVAKLTERLGDRTTAVAAVNGVLEEIESSVARGERVSLLGFGTFDRRERAPRTARNPRTGAPVEVSAASVPVFRPGAAFRSRLDASPVAVAAAPAAAPAVTSDVGASGTGSGTNAGNKSGKKAGKKAEIKADKEKAKAKGKGKKAGKDGSKGR